MRNIYLIITFFFFTSYLPILGQKIKDPAIYQINVKKGDIYFIEVLPQKPKFFFNSHLLKWIGTATSTIFTQLPSTSERNEKGDIIHKTNFIPSISVGSSILISDYSKKLKIKDNNLYYQILDSNGSTTEIMNKKLKNGRTQISNTAEKTGILTITLSNAYNKSVNIHIESNLGEIPIDTLNYNQENYNRYSGDSLGSDGGYPNGGAPGSEPYTWPEIVITAPQNPCVSNPFICGCPLESPSCNEPQYPTNIEIPNTPDPCIDNPCACGNCGGYSEIPDEEDLLETFPDLNQCEISWAISNLRKAAIAYTIKVYIEDLFATNDSLIFEGGNQDYTRANAMKHFLWNIKMGCNSNLSINDVSTIALNHEICNGQPVTNLESYQMDMINNAIGQEYIHYVKARNKCDDEQYLINLAFSMLPELSWPR
jgi:hypothetical protein